MTQVYRVGVLGLGEGRSVLSAVIGSKHWELGNMCDLSEELCRTRQQEFGIDKYTTRYEDMLEDPQIDVIAIYTPDQLHGRHIMQALRAGKHVICTKPLLNNLDEAAELIRVQQETGKHVFVGQSSRFFEPMLHQREDYEEGRHGDLLSVEAQYITDARWFLAKGWSLKGGFSWMHNFMIHAVDLVRWYLPDIAEVFGYGTASESTTEYGLDCPDTMMFLAKDSTGRMGLIRGSYTAPPLGRETEPTISCLLRGSKGTSRAEYSKLQYVRRFDEQTEILDFNDRHDYYFRFEGESHHAGEYQNYIEYFARCLDNDETPYPNVDEGIGTLIILAAMEKSLKLGRPVQISEMRAELGL
ncbi:MAG: hypothetical protein PWP10_3214 [Clostridiales bacterium]|jgi:predicted dehydrogenase|nr:hypothetical protein [Clostridiales bacterium]